MSSNTFTMSFGSPNKGSAFILYSVVSGILLLQLPLNGSLPGNWDSWLYLYLFNYYQDFVSSFFAGADIYQPFFPETSPPFLFGEPSFFNALIFLPVLWITGDAIWAYYIFTCIILSLNGLGVYLISNKLFNKRQSGLLAGCLFICSNYVLSSIDQQNVLSVYPSLFSFYFILLFTESRKDKHLLYAAIWAGIQVYCSGYHFLYYGIFLSIWFVFYGRTYVNRESLRGFVLACLTGIILLIPFVYMYLLGSIRHEAVNPVNERILSEISFSIKDIIKFHPYNALYGNKNEQNLLFFLHSTGIGIVWAVLFIYGLIKSKHSWFVLTTTALFFMLSMGPQWNFMGMILQSPLYFLLDITGLDIFMRTPVRAVMVVLIISSMLISKTLVNSWEYKRLLAVFLIGVIALENIPLRLQQYSSKQYLSPPKNLLDSTAQMSDNEVLWLHPSKLYEPGEVTNAGLGQVNREYIYMYWQTQHKRSMVNGMNGYVPKSNAALRLHPDKYPKTMTVNGKEYLFRHIHVEHMFYDGERTKD